MTFLTDLRGMSEAAVSQLTERFGDLPRPLLAAIGAGDFAVEQLAELRAALTATLEHQATGTTGDAKALAGDLPHRMQDAAAEVMESVQKLATDAPARTQQLVEQLPARMADIREAFSPEQLKGAVDGYAQLAAIIYGSLAERGDKKVATVLATSEHGAAAATAAAATAAKTATTAASETAGTVASFAAEAADSAAAAADRTAAAAGAVADRAAEAADAVRATDIEASVAKSSAARAEKAAGQRADAAAAEAEQTAGETATAVSAVAGQANAVLRPTATPREKSPTAKPTSRTRRPTVVPAVEKPAKNRATRAAGAPRRSATPNPRTGGRPAAEPPAE